MALSRVLASLVDQHGDVAFAGAFVALSLVLNVEGWINTIVLAAFQEDALETIAGIDRASDDDLLMFSNGPARLRKEIADLRRVHDGPFARPGVAR